MHAHHSSKPNKNSPTNIAYSPHIITFQSETRPQGDMTKSFNLQFGTHKAVDRSEGVHDEEAVHVHNSSGCTQLSPTGKEERRRKETVT